MNYQQLFNLAHQWVQEAYMKGLGKQCDIDGAREAFARALDADLSRLRDTQRALVEALRTIAAPGFGLELGDSSDDRAVYWSNVAESCRGIARAALASVEKAESVHLASAGGTEAAARDALRYRWLRDKANNVPTRASMVVMVDDKFRPGWQDARYGRHLDEAIDAAMSTEPNP